jgi:HlyD family secretion protein
MPFSDWLKSPRRPLYLIAPVALVAIALWAFWPRAVPVDAATVQRAALTVTFTEEGRTRLRDRYLVSAPVDGLIERIALEPGDAVAAGQTVALLRPSSAALFDPASRSDAEARWRAAEDELAAAQAAVAAADASVKRLHASLERAESLRSRGLVSQDALDAAKAQSSIADSDLRAARATARAAATRRDGARQLIDLQGARAGSDRRLALHAPVTGRVMRRFVESEGPVRAGQSLLELGDPSALEVVVEALTADATRIAPGTPVRLLRWGGADALQGRVQVIEPGGFTKISALGVEEQRVLVIVSVDDPPESRPNLGDGFRVEAEFQVWHADQVLTLSTAALFRDGSEWAVYAIEEGRAQIRRVQLGHIGERGAEVVSGLKEGAAVVLYPGDNIREGLRVVSDGARP